MAAELLAAVLIPLAALSWSSWRDGGAFESLPAFLMWLLVSYALTVGAVHFAAQVLHGR